MLFDSDSFLHSVLRAAVLSAALQSPALALAYRPADGPVRNLWRNEAIEGAACADPYSSARSYGLGKERVNPKPTLLVQFETVGGNSVAAWAMATGLYEAIALDQNGREIRMKEIFAYRASDDSPLGKWMIVNVVTASGPKLVQRDGKGRSHIVTNLEMGFYQSAFVGSG